jgi:DNA-binding response OmpR family regulator
VSRILVVEDTLELLEVVQANLELEEYEVFVATRAAQAIVLAATQKPDLIVLDLGLPDKDGYHVLREVRGRGILCPILILSARNQEADKIEGFQLGADDYVTKPFSVIELLARVGAMLRRSQWTRPAPEPEEKAGALHPLSDEELRERFTLTPRQIVVARMLGEGARRRYADESARADAAGGGDTFHHALGGYRPCLRNLDHG